MRLPSLSGILLLISVNVLGRPIASKPVSSGGVMESSSKVLKLTSQGEGERESYQKILDTMIEEAYDFASIAKQKGLDFSDSIEIPRASDLASRTEKLLEDPYLYTDPVNRDQTPLAIESHLRELLLEHDRETAAIMIAISVTKEMHSRTGDRRRAIDSGLRVGLAVLTEAVLVAPLDGIGDVRIMTIQTALSCQ